MSSKAQLEVLHGNGIQYVKLAKRVSQNASWGKQAKLANDTPLVVHV